MLLEKVIERVAQRVSTRSTVVGPFLLDNVPASQTDTRIGYGSTGGPQIDWTAPRGGSVIGITGALTVAPAGSDPVLEVYVNGALLDAACILTISTQLSLAHYAVFRTGLYRFSAGDRLGLAITTDGSWGATTSDLAASLELDLDRS